MLDYSLEFFVQKISKNNNYTYLSLKPYTLLLEEQCNNPRFGRIKKAELISKNYKVLLSRFFYYE